MPRKDGFATNNELLVDFNIAAHDVFVAGFERQMQHKIPAAYQDKPLTAFGMTISEQHPVTDVTAPALEKLSITPINTPEFEYSVESTIVKSRIPEDAWPFYTAATDRIGQLVLTDELVMRRDVPVQAVDSHWSLEAGRTRHVSTYKEKPAKASLVSGIYFAEQAKEYVLSDEFSQPAIMRMLRRMNGEMVHSFTIQPIVGLPLNGYESTGFLENYAGIMQQRSEVRLARLARLRDLGVPNAIIESEQQSYDAMHNSWQRASKLLGERD